MKILSTFLIVFSLFLCGCASSTHMRSFVDKSFDLEIRKMLVISSMAALDFNLSGPSYKILFETALRREIAPMGTELKIVSWDGEALNPEIEFKNAIDSYEPDVILTVSPQDVYAPSGLISSMRVDVSLYVAGEENKDRGRVWRNISTVIHQGHMSSDSKKNTMDTFAKDLVIQMKIDGLKLRKYRGENYKSKENEEEVEYL